MTTPGKTIVLALIAATLLGTGAGALAQSRDSTAAREAATERYMRAVPMSTMMQDAYSELSKQWPSEQRAAFMADMRRLVKVDSIEQLVRASLIKHFTAEELNALADFYSSRPGASAMSKFGVYMADVMPALMQEITRAMQELRSPASK